MDSNMVIAAWDLAEKIALLGWKLQVALLDPTRLFSEAAWAHHWVHQLAVEVMDLDGPIAERVKLKDEVRDAWVRSPFQESKLAHLRGETLSLHSQAETALRDCRDDFDRFAAIHIRYARQIANPGRRLARDLERLVRDRTGEQEEAAFLLSMMLERVMYPVDCFRDCFIYYPPDMYPDWSPKFFVAKKPQPFPEKLPPFWKKELGKMLRLNGLDESMMPGDDQVWAEPFRSIMLDVPGVHAVDLYSINPNLRPYQLRRFKEAIRVRLLSIRPEPISPTTMRTSGLELVADEWGTACSATAAVPRNAVAPNPDEENPKVSVEVKYKALREDRQPGCRRRNKPGESEPKIAAYLEKEDPDFTRNISVNRIKSETNVRRTTIYNSKSFKQYQSKSQLDSTNYNNCKSVDSVNSRDSKFSNIGIDDEHLVGFENREMLNKMINGYVQKEDWGHVLLAIEQDRLDDPAVQQLLKDLQQERNDLLKHRDDIKDVRTKDLLDERIANGDFYLAWMMLEQAAFSSGELPPKRPSYRRDETVLDQLRSRPESRRA